MRRGYFARDPEAVLSTRSPDTFSITTSGDTLESDRVLAYIRASFAQVETTLAVDGKLGVIDLHGDTAAVELSTGCAARPRAESFASWTRAPTSGSPGFARPASGTYGASITSARAYGS